MLTASPETHDWESVTWNDGDDQIWDCGVYGDKLLYFMTDYWVLRSGKDGLGPSGSKKRLAAPPKEAAKRPRKGKKKDTDR
jgi:hypothetical protein